MSKEQEDTARGLTRNFAETTSMHGVSRIVGKPGVFRRCFWVLAVLGGVAVAGFSIWNIGVAYSLREVSTTVSLEYNSELVFPSVTICNLNPVLLSQMKRNSALQSVRDAIGFDNVNETDSNNVDYPDWETATRSYSYYNKYDEDYETTVNFQEEVAKLTRQEKMHIGHDLNDMLLECTYKGKPCTPKNFTKFYNYMHGNCYSFDPSGSDFEKVSRAGPLYGLSLTLYAEENEYISELSDSVGFKVVVHSSFQMPFPEDEGFDISPGFQTNVGVTKIEVVRTPPPYGKCESYSSNPHLLPDNIFTAELAGLGFSDKACEKSCLQKMLIGQCGCCDNRYPCDKKSISFITNDAPDDVPFCEYLLGEDSCATRLIEDYEEHLTGCRDECLPNCHGESHQLEISMSRWPSPGKVDALKEAITNIARAKDVNVSVDSTSTQDQKKDFIRQNTLKLEVFYKQLNFEKIETKPAYDWSRLLSDVGGQAGLWLGFSLLTLGEVLELLLDITISFFKKFCRINRDVSPVKPLR